MIRAIAAAYPNYRSQYSNEMQKDAIDIWSVIFRDDEYEMVSAALYTYMSRPYEFAPAPGQIKDILYTLQHPNEPSEAEAWALVRKAIKRGIYHYNEEYAMLPDVVQKAVGSADYIHELAMMEDVNWTVEESLFSKRFKEEKEQVRQRGSLPKNVRQYVDRRAEAIAQEEETRNPKLIEDQKIDYAALVQKTIDREREETEQRFAELKPNKFHQIIDEKRSEKSWAVVPDETEEAEQNEEFNIPEPMQRYADEHGINLREIPTETLKILSEYEEFEDQLDFLTEFQYPQARIAHG